MSALDRHGVLSKDMDSDTVSGQEKRAFCGQHLLIVIRRSNLRMHVDCPECAAIMDFQGVDLRDPVAVERWLAL